MNEKIDLNQLLLDGEFLTSNRKLYLDDFDDEDIYWFNDESNQMLNNGYLMRGERVLDAIHRVCYAAAKKYRNTQIDVDVAYKHFVRNVILGWQSFSSPIWSNMGTSRALPISCFGVYVGDSIMSITDKLGEVINQTKIGGGTSGYFGELRGRGTPVKDNGKSSGSVSFMQMFDSVMNVVSQGSQRRGSFAAYLDIDHPDIEEFLQIKDVGNPIQNLFFGVNFPDWWLNDMFYGKDIEKRKLWAKVLKSRQEKGLPYILFSDTINKNKPQIYQELKETIHASNLCFTGDTVVAIADGTNGKTIKELAEFSQGKIKFPVYCATDKLQKNKIGKTNGGIINNYNWKTEIKNAVAFKTGTKKVIEITLSNGDKFKCTPNHKLSLKNGGYVEAQNSLNSELESFFTFTEKNNNLKGLYVIDIQDAGEEDVYDLTVEDNHNFYIITSTEDERYENCQGVLVHNCSEIALPSSINESFVCCLASMNLEQYDEWKDTDAVYWAILFLDAVMEDFIAKTENYKYLESAHNFAKRHRALGLGVMGYHSYLQKNMIPFESWEAKQFNAKVFKQLYIESRDASIELAELLGPAPIFNELSHKEDMEDVVTLMRNTTVLAIAPTTSSSSILGQVSPGIEPYSSNYFKAGLAKGNFMRTNKYLKKLLIEKDKDDEDTWRSIMLAHGSVQHLDFLSDNEKEVFKTFKEISPLEIIAQAAQRQQYIDQMQSLNLLIPSQMDIKDVNKLYLQAWESGVKSLYYQRSSSVSKEMMTKFVNCQSCES
jgi:ribonucleotide reductase alpha subunit